MCATRFFRISAAKMGPNLLHQNRTVSWLMSIPRSHSRSSTLRSDSGCFTYIITARRIISGELLKYRKGLLMTGTYPKLEVAPNDWSDNADDRSETSRSGFVARSRRLLRWYARGENRPRRFPNASGGIRERGGCGACFRAGRHRFWIRNKISADRHGRRWFSIGCWVWILGRRSRAR